MHDQSVTDSSLGVLWSAWTELGVPGVERRYNHVAVDPEPLIVFTPALAIGDPRLMEQVSAWCARYGDCVSKTRLWGLARNAPQPILSDFASFADRLTGSAARWRQGKARVGVNSGVPSASPPLDRPALARLRMRALAGVGARADVLCELLRSDAGWLSATHLQVLGYTRRTLDRVFADMHAAGTVARRPGKGPASFRLREGKALATLVDASDLLWPDWSSMLLSCWHLVAVELSATQTPSKLALVQAYEAREVLLGLSRVAELPEPPTTASEQTAVSALLKWGSEALQEWAKPSTQPA